MKCLHPCTHDNEGSFADLDDKPQPLQEALHRIGIATRLIQCFTAENLARHNFARYTFNIQKQVQMARMNITAAQASQLGATALFTEVQSAVNKLMLDDPDEHPFFVALLNVNGGVDDKAKNHVDTQSEWMMQNALMALHPARGLCAWAHSIRYANIHKYSTIYHTIQYNTITLLGANSHSDVIPRLTDSRMVTDEKGVKGHQIGGVVWSCYSISVRVHHCIYVFISVLVHYSVLMLFVHVQVDMVADMLTWYSSGHCCTVSELG